MFVCSVLTKFWVLEFQIPEKTSFSFSIFFGIAHFKTFSNEEFAKNVQSEEVSVPKKWCFEWSVYLYMYDCGVFVQVVYVS